MDRVLEVTSGPYQSTEPRIWDSDDYPSRIDVRIELELTPDRGPGFRPAAGHAHVRQGQGQGLPYSDRWS
jgi:hypothetical protein